MKLPTTSPAPSTSKPSSPAEEMAGRIQTASLDRLIAALPGAVDTAMRKAIPRLYSPEKVREIADGAIAELRQKYAQEQVPASPVAAMLNTGQCCARRPGRDPLTGHRIDGVEETEETWPDRLLCTLRHGHDGDHRDALKHTWAHDLDEDTDARIEGHVDRIMTALTEAKPETTA